MRHGWIVVLLLAGATAAAAEGKPWEGEWVTDLGRLVLRQDGTSVEGEYGKGGTLSGKVAGGTLAFTWQQGGGSGDGEFELTAEGAFTGKWTSPRGEGGTWRGWRKDPDAEKGSPADFSGTWLSSLGTLVLEQKGDRVEGTYGSQGWATLRGTVKGRRLSLEWKRIQWSGKAWIEQTPDGKRIFGLTEEETPTKWLGVRLEGFEPGVAPKAGEIVQGLSKNAMCYFLRAPKGWRKGKKTDAIVILHGSNWTTKGMVFVTAGNWKDLGDDYFIIGIQGEQWADWSEPDDLRFNYTYVNWVGRSTLGGYPYTDRESPYLVHQVVEELKEAHGLDRIFVVGHSQGGFLAYYMLMHDPETFAGVAALSCGLTVQCEPDVFTDAALLRAQRATPLVMVHGTADPQWGPSSGDDIYERFAASGFPMLAYLKPNAGHPYDYLPVGDAVHWLDAMSTRDAWKLQQFTEDRAKDGAWRDVAAALVHADQIGARRKLKAVESKLDAEAKKDADAHLQAIKKNEDGSWVDGFLEWRDRFEFAPAAKDVMKTFHALRDRHDEPAEKLIGEARAAFQSGDRDAGWAKYEEVVKKYYACRRYRLVKRWLADRR